MAGEPDGTGANGTNGTARPRYRVAAGSREITADEYAADSYQNFMASVGQGTPNLSSGSTYGFDPITRQRILLEWLYRGSWVCGVAVDSVADDMCKLGVDFSGTVKPEDGEAIEHALNRLQIWNELNELIKWGRLYGGAIAVIMIRGQDPATPLRVETVGFDGFQGLQVFDRWQVEPSLNDLVTIPGPDRGLPRFYRTYRDALSVPPMVVHHSRVIRYEGIRLPYWQRVAENLWGMSIFERLWDRLTAFDSTTQGIAQLVYKAYLRIVKLKDLREVASMSPEAQRGLMRRIEVMTHFQTTEGVTLLGEGDEFQSIAYAFAGLDQVLVQFGQQLCGALQIPGVRMFGQSPAGLNATGDSDWRNYFDGINQQQELRLRRGLTLILSLVAKAGGIILPPSWNFLFRSLWQLTTKEKAEVADLNTRTILAADEMGIVPRKTTLQELRQSGRETGVWQTITDEMIDQAEDDLPPPPGMGGVPGPAWRQEGAPGAPGETLGAPQFGPSGRQPGPGGSPARLGASLGDPVPPPRVSLGRGSTGSTSS